MSTALQRFLARAVLLGALSVADGQNKVPPPPPEPASSFGEILPGFLRVPPPVFSASPPGKPIRVVAFGDFGYGNEAQAAVAQAMVRYDAGHKFDFGITLGDNFYNFGMDSPEDPRWQSQFEALYGPLHVLIYATLGNHDYGQPDSPAAEILYSGRSPDWRMPAPYYTYTAGPVQFFAIDTMNLSDKQLQWLSAQLAASAAIWKLVYGHYPIYSATGDDRTLIAKLLPVLKDGHADIYLAGHHHNLQALKPDGSLHFLISGGGGARLHALNPFDRRAEFRDRVNGFTVLEADAQHFTARFVGVTGDELHSETFSK